MRGFRFGVQAAAPPTAPPGTVATAVTEPRWADFVRRAEDYGYDIVSLPDHLDGQLAPLVALGYAAAITDRIHLATTVLANDFRNPAILATEATTLDELSGNRFELGLGAGWKQADYDVTGIPLDRPSLRIDRLAESVARLRRDLPPTVPLMLGGGGRRMLELAAREADIVSIVPGNPSGVAPTLGDGATLDQMRARVEWVKQSAGPRVDAVELHTRVVAAADEDAVRGLDPDAAASSPHVLVRPVAAMVDKLQRLRDDVGLSYFTVSERFLDDFAPVVDRLSGS